MSARAQGNSLVQSLLWEELFHLTGHLLGWGRRVGHGIGRGRGGPQTRFEPQLPSSGTREVTWLPLRLSCPICKMGHQEHV